MSNENIKASFELYQAHASAFESLQVSFNYVEHNVKDAEARLIAVMSQDDVGFISIGKKDVTIVEGADGCAHVVVVDSSS